MCWMHIMLCATSGNGFLKVRVKFCYNGSRVSTHVVWQELRQVGPPRGLHATS